MEVSVTSSLRKTPLSFAFLFSSNLLSLSQGIYYSLFSEVDWGEVHRYYLMPSEAPHWHVTRLGHRGNLMVSAAGLPDRHPPLLNG